MHIQYENFLLCKLIILYTTQQQQQQQQQLSKLNHQQTPLLFVQDTKYVWRPRRWNALATVYNSWTQLQGVVDELDYW